MNCECDKKFYECLLKQGSGDKVAQAVGLFYFDKIGKECFTYDNSTGISRIVQTSKFRAGLWNVPVIG